MNTLGDIVAKRGVHKGGKGKTDKRKSSKKARSDTKAKPLNAFRGRATRPVVKKIRAAGIRQPHHKGILA